MEGDQIAEYFFHFKGNVVQPQWVHRNTLWVLRQSSGVRLAREWRDNGGPDPVQTTIVPGYSSSNHNVSIAPTISSPPDLRAPPTHAPTRSPTTRITTQRPAPAPPPPPPPPPLPPPPSPTPPPRRAQGSLKSIPSKRLNSESQQLVVTAAIGFDITKVAKDWKQAMTPHVPASKPTMNDDEMERMRAIQNMQLRRMQNTIVSYHLIYLFRI